MKKILLLAIMLTGSFALANNVESSVSLEIKQETEIVTQTDILSVQNDVSSDYQHQTDQFYSESEDVATCYTRDCIIYNGRKYCTGWQEIPCPIVIVIIIVVVE